MTLKHSKYQDIWAKIKRDGKCVVKTHPLYFSRLTKAIIKVKGKDHCFKLMNPRDYFFLDIFKDTEKQTVTFVLRQRYGIEERKVV